MLFHYLKLFIKKNDPNNNNNNTNNNHNIVIEDNNENLKYFEYKHKAYLLYMKYIRENCQFEINVSFELRYYYFQLFNDQQGFFEKNKNYNNSIKLYQLFDKCIDEMFMLMLDTFCRFRKTKKYQDCMNIINPKVIIKTNSTLTN